MSHLILLGDSIFDNAAYTDGGPDVVTQLNDVLLAGWAASLLAIDGSITGDIAGQVGCLPADEGSRSTSRKEALGCWSLFKPRLRTGFNNRAVHVASSVRHQDQCGRSG
jgi:hypothetical protein